jgi:hypothetical protein
MAASSVLTEGHQGPQKCLPNLASFRQVDAESEIVFSKKSESFRGSQGILVPCFYQFREKRTRGRQARHMLRQMKLIT